MDPEYRHDPHELARRTRDLRERIRIKRVDQEARSTDIARAVRPAWIAAGAGRARGADLAAGVVLPSLTTASGWSVRRPVGPARR